MTRNHREALFQQYEQRGDVLGQYFPYHNFNAAELAKYTKRHVATQASGAATSLTPSVGTDGSTGPPVNTFNVTAAAGGSDNHREFFLRPDTNFEYSQVTSIIYGGGTWADGNNRSQQGHVHRFQQLPNGRIRAYVAWHDIVIASPTAINIGIWEIDGTGTTPLNLHSVNTFLPLTAQPTIPVTICSRATNLISAWTAGRHWLRIDDLVNLTVRDESIANLRIQNVAFTNLLQIPHVAADDTDMGPGLISKAVGPLDKFPYVMSSRLIPGDIFQAKIWRPWDPEPPWSGSSVITYATPNPVTPAGSAFGPPLDERWPRGRGLSGVMVGHIWNSRLVRFGLPDIRQVIG